MTLDDIIEAQTEHTDSNPHTLVEEVHYLIKQLNNIIELLQDAQNN